MDGQGELRMIVCGRSCGQAVMSGLGGRNCQVQVTALGGFAIKADVLVGQVIDAPVENNPIRLFCGKRMKR